MIASRNAVDFSCLVTPTGQYLATSWQLQLNTLSIIIPPVYCSYRCVLLTLTQQTEGVFESKKENISFLKEFPFISIFFFPMKIKTKRSLISLSLYPAIASMVKNQGKTSGSVWKPLYFVGMNEFQRKEIQFIKFSPTNNRNEELKTY